MQSEAESKLALERRERKKLREKRKQERLERKPVQPESKCGNDVCFKSRETKTLVHIRYQDATQARR